MAEDPCWYTVGAVGTSIQDATPRPVQDAARYLPPECDVPIRRNWFWQPDDVGTLKSREHLLAIWYRSVGLGANLLLNVPPDRRGLIDDHDAARVRAFARTLRDRFARPIPATLAQDGPRITVDFGQGVRFDHLILRERLENGQHIGRHRVVEGRGGRVIVDGVRTVGSQRVHAFPEVVADRLVIEIDDPAGALDSVDAHLTGVEAAPAMEAQPAAMAEKFEQARGEHRLSQDDLQAVSPADRDG